MICYFSFVKITNESKDYLLVHSFYTDLKSGRISGNENTDHENINVEICMTSYCGVVLVSDLSYKDLFHSFVLLEKGYSGLHHCTKVVWIRFDKMQITLYCLRSFSYAYKCVCLTTALLIGQVTNLRLSYIMSNVIRT